MKLTINGEDRDVQDVHTVSDLLGAFGLQNKILVIELNMAIVERKQYDSVHLQDGDKIEIVHFVGGG